MSPKLMFFLINQKEVRLLKNTLLCPISSLLVFTRRQGMQILNKKGRFAKVLRYNTTNIQQ